MEKFFNTVVSGIRRILPAFLFMLAISSPLVLYSAPRTHLVTGVAAGTGVALDTAHNHLYYLEWAAGNLKRVHLNPACETADPGTCVIDTVAAGFIHPQDVALDVAHGVAYVTTRDDPGTTGKFWRVNLTTGVKSLVTFNLGAPHQIVLDVAANSAYVAGFDSGKLWRIDLTTGVKIPLMTGLGHPIGLAINSDRTLAYVTEQDTLRVTEVSLAAGVRIRDIATALTAPFFLQWTDPACVALYLVERDPANRVSRIDLPTSTRSVIAAALPVRPSGIAANFATGVLYVTTNTIVERVPLDGLDLGEPVFLGVGHVPATSITDGYANTTATNAFPNVKHSPFGGTMQLFGNLSNFKALGATHYRIRVTAPGGASTVISRSWDTSHWNTVSGSFEPETITPEPGGYYAIPSEYPTFAYRWYPSFLMMVWPSGANGMHTFNVELFQKVGAVWNPVAFPAMPAAKRNLNLLIDNSPATVELVSIRQHGSATSIAPCQIVSAGVNLYDFQTTAYDPNHHLLSYSLTAYWGKNKSEGVTSDTYGSHVDAEGPYLWSGVSGQWLPAAGWDAHCNCAHTFYLRVWKRTINGDWYTLYQESHQSITINNTGTVCPAP